jgi:hypothetical protein
MVRLPSLPKSPSNSKPFESGYAPAPLPASAGASLECSIVRPESSNSERPCAFARDPRHTPRRNSGWRREGGASRRAPGKVPASVSTIASASDCASAWSESCFMGCSIRREHRTSLGHRRACRLASDGTLIHERGKITSEVTATAGPRSGLVSAFHPNRTLADVCSRPEADIHSDPIVRCGARPVDVNVFARMLRENLGCPLLVVRRPGPHPKQ